MSWKSMPYWLKGGIICAMIFGVISIILVILTAQCFNKVVESATGAGGYECLALALPTLFTGFLPLALFPDLGEIYVIGGYALGVSMGGIFVNIIIGFLIGAFGANLYKRMRTKA